MPTSLKLPPPLKARVAAISKRAGRSPHAFMVEAIEQVTTDAELRETFVQDALDAEREAVDSGKAYRLEDVAQYLDQRAAGKKARRPRARAWRR